MCRNLGSGRLEKSNGVAGHFSPIKSEILTILMAALHSENYSLWIFSLEFMIHAVVERM